ncbi:MAG: DUF1850 domain-containing protein [Nitratireductor sp.]
MSAAACLLIGSKQILLAGGAFHSLLWTHSVEKTEWRESWMVRDGMLELIEARVRGSGAGMDPGEGARLQDGWWVWKPQNPPVSELNLAASGATVSPWRFCSGDQCLELGASAGEPVHLAPCNSAG